eukprot:scaffold544_cov117-Isochrysis_galbana.AAC.25
MCLALDGDDQLTKFWFIDGFNLAQIKAPGAYGRIFSLRVIDSKAIGDEPALLSACLAALVRLIQPSTGDSRHSTRAAPSGARLWSKEGPAVLVLGPPLAARSHIAHTTAPEDQSRRVNHACEDDLHSR